MTNCIIQYYYNNRVFFLKSIVESPSTGKPRLFLVDDENDADIYQPFVARLVANVINDNEHFITLKDGSSHHRRNVCPNPAHYYSL